MTFIASLPHHSGTNVIADRSFCLFTLDNEHRFDFSALSPEQLACILGANPRQQFQLQGGIWSAAHSIILATRSYPLDLTVGASNFSFQDQGTAFVDALENNRQFSSFGSLGIENDEDSVLPFSRANLERIFRLEMFDKLNMCGRLDDAELICLGLSVKVNALEFYIDAVHVPPEDLDVIHIVAKDLHLQVDGTEAIRWDAVLTSILNRVAAAGYVERLNFAVLGCRRTESLYREKSALVADALVRAVQTNPKLMHLQLCSTYHWDPHLQKLLRAMEDHSVLRTFVVKHYPRDADPDYSWLKQLVSRNRDITVFDYYFQRITDGSSIDKIYALNCFYHGSASLTKESADVRPLLFTTALNRSAFANFQYTALLLSNHTDMLCELVNGVNLDGVVTAEHVSDEARPADSHCNTKNRSKRRAKIQLPRRLVKKATPRNDT